MEEIKSKNARGFRNISLRIRKYHLRDILFVTLFAILAETRFSFHVLGQQGCMLIVAVTGFVCYLSGTNKSIKKQIYKYLLLAALPFLFALLHTTIVVSMYNQYNLSIIPQAFTSTGFAFVQMMYVGALILFYKEKTIDILYYIIVISYTISVAWALIEHPISEIVANYNTIYNYLERHDIGVSAESIILYYLYQIIFIKQRNKLYTRRIVIMTVILLLCGKRSAFLSIGVAVFAMFILSSKIKNKYKYCNILAAIIVMFLYVFVALIQTGIIIVLCQKLGISTFGRIDVWSWFNNQYNITPLYFGKGFQYIHKYMMAYIAEGGNQTSMISMFGYLHNSDLQIFIELGFLGFFLWFFYYLSWYPNKIKRKFGISSYYLCFIMMISMVVMYMTDNTLTYPVYQTTTYGMIFVHVYLNEQRKSVC